MRQDFHAYPIIFTHIPRSAGTTLVDIARMRYRPDEQFHVYVRQEAGNTDEALAEFRRLPDEKRKRLKLLLGHTSFGIHEYFDTYTYITLFRDPVERIISYYYYILTQPGHYLHELVLRGRMRLEQFVTSGMSSELDNIQTRQLSGATDVPYGKCTKAMLDTAKLNLVRQYSVFGITERFDESIMLIKRRFGWQYPFYVKRNTIPERAPRESIPPRTVHLITHTNALDVEFYQFALLKFQAVIEHQDDSFHEELKRFRAYNAVFEKPLYMRRAKQFIWNQYLRTCRLIGKGQ